MKYPRNSVLNHVKPFPAVLLAIFLICIVFVPAASAYDEAGCLINNKGISAGTPLMMNDRVMVPVGALSDLLVEYDSNTGQESVEMERGPVKLVLFINDTRAVCNGQEVFVDAPAAKVESTIYVPLRLVVESFGGTVEWDNNRNLAIAIDEPSLYLEGIDATVVNVYSAEEVNQWWFGKGYTEPPYRPESNVVEASLDDEHVFGRTYDGQVSGKFGGWVLNNTDIDGLTPEEIRNGWALPALPVYRVDVVISQGTHIRAGVAAPVQGWGEGGMVQFDLMGQRTGDFVNERPILN